MAKLAGRVAIITGAAAGQGRAEALLFARNGAKVIATDVDAAGLALLAEEVKGAQLDITVAVHDVSDATAWQDVFDLVMSRHGRIDILVNNAAIYMPGISAEATTEAQWQRFFDINLMGVMHGVLTVMPEMKARRRGAIVNVASIAALRGGMGAAYSATKGGVVALSRNLAVELGPFGVRINTLIPGPTETAMVKGAMATDEGRQALESTVVLQRLGQPEEIANAALFLASDDASFITGTELVVDGGRIAR